MLKVLKELINNVFLGIAVCFLFVIVAVIDLFVYLKDLFSGK